MGRYEDAIKAENQRRDRMAQEAFAAELGRPSPARRRTMTTRSGTERRAELAYRERKIEEMKGTRQFRAFTGVELEMREVSSQELSLIMHASKVERVYTVGWYTETIARGAFNAALKSDPDVQLLINH